MDRLAETFESHRARLAGVAHRMLRNRADAEDVLQDAYLRWQEAAVEDIASPIGFLVTVTTRLCLDRIRRARKEREESASLWRECFGDDRVRSPEAERELAEDVCAAFRFILERLGSEQRTVFLLREVFDYDYQEVARMVGKSPTACRQLIHRSRMHLRDCRPRFAVTRQYCERALEKLAAALATCDRHAVLPLLAEMVECVPVPLASERAAPLRAPADRRGSVRQRAAMP